MWNNRCCIQQNFLVSYWKYCGFCCCVVCSISLLGIIALHCFQVLSSPINVLSCFIIHYWKYWGTLPLLPHFICVNACLIYLATMIGDINRLPVNEPFYYNLMSLLVSCEFWLKLYFIKYGSFWLNIICSLPLIWLTFAWNVFFHLSVYFHH